MKITLKAHIQEHREIAKLFVGQFVEYSCLSVLVGELIGVRDTTLSRFQVDSSLTKEITIDTLKAQMDLRLAIGTRIEFLGYGVLLACDDVWGYFDKEFQETCLLRNLKLSKDYLKSVVVEAVE